MTQPTKKRVRYIFIETLRSARAEQKSADFMRVYRKMYFTLFFVGLASLVLYNMCMNIFDKLKPNFKGDIDYSEKTLITYSRDASLFEIKPKVVLFPKDSADVQTVVKFVNENRKDDPTLSITARSAGTDMSGGAINASIILDFTRYMNAIIKITPEFGIVQPGCYYRDFEKETLKKQSIMPTYTASKEICAVGGMVANNSGGEKSLKYGKTENYINSLKVVFTDGNEYTVKPLTEDELKEKISKGGFEGELYKKMWEVITSNYETLKEAKPNVSKNSSGYYLWNVYNKMIGVFDLCRLIVGSQGTLGIVTEINFKLVPVKPFSNILTIYMPEISHVSELVNEILPYGPESLESYDDYSMKLAVKFFFDFFTSMGFWKTIRLGFQFIPDALLIAIGGKIPKLILMVEFSGDSEEEIYEKLVEVKKKITHFGYKVHIAKSSAEAEKYWKIRHESFNLLRKHVHGKRTAPFIDDVIVKPEYLPKFLPQMQKLIDEYKLIYTVAGHVGNGNFHIIPLMDMKSPFSSDVILDLSKKVYDLVAKYHGSITAEHNDGIIRTPYLNQMFGEEIVKLFKETKDIFDPENIFNPGKKVGGSFQDIKDHLIKENQG